MCPCQALQQSGLVVLIVGEKLAEALLGQIDGGDKLAIAETGYLDDVLLQRIRRFPSFLPRLKLIESVAGADGAVRLAPHSTL